MVVGGDSDPAVKGLAKDLAVAGASRVHCTSFFSSPLFYYHV